MQMQNEQQTTFVNKKVEPHWHCEGLVCIMIDKGDDFESYKDKGEDFESYER